MTTWAPWWILAVMVSAVAAAVVPWRLARGRRAEAALGLATSLLLFAAYEVILYRRASPGGVVFQMELVMLVPLLAVAAVSCGAALILGGRRDRI